LLAGALVIAVAGALLYRNWPFQDVERGKVGFRTNRLTGEVTEWRDGSAFVLPGLHQVRVLSLRDSVYRPTQSTRADGEAPLQSLEGLSFGVDLSARYAIDPAKARSIAATLPDDVAHEIVEPAVQGIIYKTFARYTVREIFSTKRVEIQQAIETELRAKLAADGIALRSLLIGKVDLPPEYRRGMNELLAEELASEKMRYTLDLKEKRVKETELEGEADKVRRTKSAEAMATTQIIAARAQEESMKYVLPLKERQIEQRKLEAEAERGARIKQAEATAEARRIEAKGEAEARQMFADAEAYRLEQIGKAVTAQMVREGTVMSRHPLLIQKVLADKLSDKVQVIIAPPSVDGSLVGAVLGGKQK
jgi:regulator of protease activity HflC (stomatin/prohibitin superfamily)